MSFGIRTLSLFTLLLAFAAVLKQAATARDIPAGLNKNDKKKPDCLLDPDGNLLIPGIGRVMVPPQSRLPLPHLGHGGLTVPVAGRGGSVSTPTGGSPLSGGSPPVGGSPPAGGSYIPGGDDTFVPNPGVEVPNPNRGARTPAPNRP
ncbi:putative cell wall protein [Punica granatum]|uniref:Cell wall protein n=2 Tax=Punica granatum TaxID=22663 RepID=A0A6P8DA35_PUNGR|nr:putative cell wall protein [Punica granatum]PKI52963.1 hypothetical protein CRG98_026669 [Punica granatum]